MSKPEIARIKYYEGRIYVIDKQNYVWTRRWFKWRIVGREDD